MYQKTLSECLEILPSYLGGSCTCLRCTNPNMRRGQQSGITQYDLSTSTSEMTCSEILPLLRPSYEADLVENGSPDQILRTAVVGILILWVFIAFMAGLFDPESRPVLLQPGTP